MAIDVRPAELGDAEVLGRIHVRAWQATYRGVMPDGYLDGLDARERSAMWAHSLQDPAEDRRLRVVAEDGRVVGFAAFGRCRDPGSDDVAELFAINLDPTAWGRGIGRRLLTAVTGGLGDFGQRAVLWVVPSNRRARSLYEACGWQHDGMQRTADVFGASVDEVRYARPLVVAT